MAKKQAETPEGAEAAAPEKKKKDAAAPAEGKKKEKGEPKAKAEGKAKPDGQPAAAQAPAAERAPAPAGEASKTKRRGKQPGVPPRRGKKLRNQLKSVRQKIDKEGVTPLKRGITLLKSIKRAKFDETVEVHMSLGIDTTQSEQML